MMNFDLKYGVIHSQIQQDSQLVSAIYSTTRSSGLKHKSEKDRYMPIGTIGAIFLGLDLSEVHVRRFGNIVQKCGYYTN